MAKYNIAVTGLNAADVPCSGISVIRSLREAWGSDIKIIGLAYELLCSTSYAKNIVDEVYYVPFPQEDEDKYLSRISEIVEKTKIDVFIPNLDFEIAVMSKIEPELRDLGIRLLVPSQEALRLCTKENLSTFARSINIHSPHSLVLNDRRQITHTASYFSYPFIVKAVYGEACLVYSLEEAIVFSNRLASLWRWPLIMQEYIKGDEYCVVALADRRQKVLDSVCMKKILKSKNGSAWMGVTAKDDYLTQLTKKIIDKLQWVGPLEIEFIKAQDSKRYFLIEINPRFPTWIQLVTKSGYNLPMAVVKIALRQKVEPFLGHKSGTLFARSAIDITCDISCLGKLAAKKELIYHESHINS